ncbi:MAG TPA: ABC transporter permease [Phototrophicaceae bacterium]|nr:ABC transporter permease [Phototrophicaceae bacterium]
MEQPLESPTTVTPAIDVVPIQRTSRLRLLRRSPSAMIGTAIVIFWVLMAIIGPLIVPYGINDIDPGKIWSAPSAAHWMGTDALGRDIFSRLIIAARLMMLLPPLAVAIGVLIGSAVGLWAGYRGGWLDEIVMRFMDVMMAFPAVMLYLMIVVAFGQSATTVVLAIAIANIPAISRLVRGLVLDLRGREFVAAARMRGESTFYILFREILPNATAPILIDALVRIGYAAFAIGALGFLGLGVPPPNPDWGGMAADGRTAIVLMPTAALFPALAIASLVIAFNLIADGLTAASKKEE